MPWVILPFMLVLAVMLAAVIVIGAVSALLAMVLVLAGAAAFTAGLLGAGWLVGCITHRRPVWEEFKLAVQRDIRWLRGQR
jgi:hypothetical protein